jgi:hypothetical protein
LVSGCWWALTWRLGFEGPLVGGCLVVCLVVCGGLLVVRCPVVFGFRKVFGCPSVGRCGPVIRRLVGRCLVE